MTIPGPSLESAFSFAIDRRLIVAVRLHERAPSANEVVRIASSLADGIVELSFAELSRPDDSNESDDSAWRNDSDDYAWRDDEDGVGGWAAPVVDVILGFDPDLAGSNRVRRAARPGFDLYIESDIPVSAGLGSSAALEVATALALNELWHEGYDRESLSMSGSPRDTFVRAAALRDAVDRTEVVRHFSVPATRESIYFAPPDDFPVDDIVPAEQRLAVLVLAEDTAEPRTAYDLALETLRSNGAVGAQPAGDGITIALTTFDDLSRLQVALDSAFSEHGSAQPATFVVVPSSGAIREN